MAKGMGGFAGGIAQGLQLGDQINTSMARRKSDELRDQQLRAQMEDQQRERDLRNAREADIRTEMGTQAEGVAPNPFAPAGPVTTADGQPVPQKRPFDAMISAAGKRLAAGDVEGYTSLIEKGTAAKTMYYTTTFTDAYRRGDVQGMLGLLNEFPDGNKYDVQQAPDGSLVAAVVTPDGKPLGTKKFANERELGAFIQQRLNPGDIAKAVREELELKSKLAVADANVRQSNAAAGASQFQVERGRTLLPHEVEAKKADIQQSRAAAANSSAHAEEARARKGTAGMGEFGKRIRDLQGAQGADGKPMFSDDEIKMLVGGTAKGKTREEAITRIAGDMAKEPVNAGMSSEELVKKAAAIVDGAAAAAGTTRVGTGPGIGRKPQGEYPVMPTDKAKLQQGQVYQTMKGPARWNGQAFEKLQ